MEWTKILIIVGLVLDIIGVVQLAKSTVPKKLRKLLENIQLPDNPEEHLKEWKRSIDLNALVPGTALEVVSQSMRTTTIGRWKVADCILPANPKELLKEILSELSRAVRIRAIVAERPCVSLSGGLDSSAILALAALQDEDSGRHKLCAQGNRIINPYFSMGLASTC